MMSMKQADGHASAVAVLALQELYCRMLDGAVVKDLTPLDIAAMIEKLQADINELGFREALTLERWDNA